MFMRGINKLLQGSKREVKDISGKGEERDPQELILKVGLEGQEEFLSNGNGRRKVLC